MTERIPVNPDVLIWARETAGLSVEDVVDKMNRAHVTAAAVLSWESGNDSPTYAQLELLAYNIYKRPLAVFFFPSPPEEDTPRQSFRTLPDYEIEQLPSQIHFLIRKAKVMQVNLAELHDNANPASRQILRDLSIDTGVSPQAMATATRDYLQVALTTQIEWRNSEEALRMWRDCLEQHGIFVFKDAFRVESFSGFCLYDETYPIIYVNNSNPKNRQIFTLFHELAHLLFRTGGIDTPDDRYIADLTGDNRRIEILCNSFAGAFLVPDQDFDGRIVDTSFTNESIQKWADTYRVSREVILRKLLDRGLVDQTDYDDRVEEWAKLAAKSSGRGGNYYRTQAAYLGERYLATAFSSYYQKRISLGQLADYLGVKVSSVPGMENLLLTREVTA